MIRKLTENEKQRVLTLLHCKMIDIINHATQDSTGFRQLVSLTFLRRLVTLATQVQAGEVDRYNFFVVMNAELEDFLK